MGAAAHVKQFNNHGLPQSINNPNAFLINRIWVKFDSEQREHNPDAQNLQHPNNIDIVYPTDSTAVILQIILFS